MSENTVVFPAPEGPTNAVIPRGGMTKLTPWWTSSNQPVPETHLLERDGGRGGGYHAAGFRRPGRQAGSTGSRSAS